MIGKQGMALCLAIGLAACAAPMPDPPAYPMTGEAPAIDQTNSAEVSGDIAEIIAGHLKPADGPLTVGGDNPLIQKSLIATLKADGYQIALRNGKHTVSYVVAPLGPALLVRVHVDDLQAARLYRAGSTGQLLPASPTSVTEG